MTLDHFGIQKCGIKLTCLLPKRDSNYLRVVFKQLKDQKLPSILEQLRNRSPLRKHIDKAVMKVLGFKEQEIEKLLPKLYDALAEEIELLKEMMNEKPPETKAS